MYGHLRPVYCGITGPDGDLVTSAPALQLFEQASAQQAVMDLTVHYPQQSMHTKYQISPQPT